jgi:hypothetical protein
MAGSSKCLRINKLEESDITEELYCDEDSEEELYESHTSAEDSQKSDSRDELNWRGNVPTDEICAHQFVGEQSGSNKTAVPNLDKNSRPLDFSCCFSTTISYNFRRNKPLRAPK